MILRFKAQITACILERISSRGAFVMSIITNALMVILTYFFWNAFSKNYSGGDFINGDTLLVYMVISVILRSLIVTFGITWRVGAMITDGTIAGILLKPLSFLEYWIFQQISRLIYSFFTLTIPLIAITLLLLPNLFRFDFHIGYFIVSSLLGFYISNVLNIVMGMTGFWLERIQSIHQLNIVLYTIASGTLAPLIIYPKAIRNILMLLPYRTIIDTPLTILINGDVKLIVVQIVWAVIITIIYSLVYSKGSRRLEVVGV